MSGTAVPIEHRRNYSVLRAVGAMVLLLATGWAYADPPGRAARLAYADAQVSFSPAGQDDWVQATVNRPLTTGDRLWSDTGARAELQLGGAAIRLGPLTNVTLLNLDDNITQLQLLQGALKLRVRRLGDSQSVEVDTPNLAFTIRRAGDYRIDVDPNGNSTAVTAISGEAEVYGDGAAYAVRARQGYTFYGTGLNDYDTFATRRDDDLDHWAQERDRRIDNSASARYVSTELVGYEDLDNNGTWRVDASYGNVWIPSRVAAGWTPYHDGHWAWVDPWGWTWVDDAPWGYAVSHYGRWARINNAWGWVPGPQREQAVYAPALVVFLGGRDFQASVSAGASTGNVGWFPLAPREVYQPSYQVSRGYFDHINRSNAVIAPTVITNIYNTNVTNVTHVTNITKMVYVNQAVAGAVVAVPAHAFVQSQSVGKLAVVVPSSAAMSAPVTHIAAVAPVAQSVQGGAAGAHSKPAGHEHNAVVAHTAPPPAPVPFAAQLAQLSAKPGTPIDEPRRALLKSASLAEPAAKVNVVTVAKAAAPTALPPASAPAPKTPDQRKALANVGTGAVTSPQAGPGPVAAVSKPAATSVDTGKPDTAKGNAARASAAATAAAAQAASDRNAEAARVDAQKRAEADKRVALNADASKQGAAKAQAAKDDAAKADAARVDAARAADAAKSGAAKKAESDRSNTANAAKADAAKADAAKVDAAKAEANKKAQFEKAQADKANAARSEAAKADAARKVEAQKVDAAKAAEAAKLAAAKSAEAAKADAQRAQAAKSEAEKAHAQAAEKAEESKAARAHSAPPNGGAKAEEEEKEKERARGEEAKKH